MQASIRLEHHLLAVEAEHRVHAMLELVAPPAPATHQRTPFHLALVIDRSASWPGRNSRPPRSSRRSWSGGSPLEGLPRVTDGR